MSVLSRFDFTAARNAVALGDRWSGSPGWLFGRLDFGLARGPNLCQIDRVSGAGESNQSSRASEPWPTLSKDRDDEDINSIYILVSSKLEKFASSIGEEKLEFGAGILPGIYRFELLSDDIFFFFLESSLIPSYYCCQVKRVRRQVGQSFDKFREKYPSRISHLCHLSPSPLTCSTCACDCVPARHSSFIRLIF